MTFSRQRAPGLWIGRSTISTGEVEVLDQHQADAFDAVNGGAYSLQADVSIGGAPGIFWEYDLDVSFNRAVGVQGTFEAFGPVGLYDNVTIGSGPGDELSVQCPASFQYVGILGVLEVFDNVGMYGSTTIGSGPGDLFAVQCPVEFDDAATFNAATFNDAATFNQFTYFNEQATFHEQTVFQKLMLLTGEARIPQRQAIGANADTTYQAKTYTHVHVLPGTLSAIRYYTIGDTGAQNGDRMRFSTRDTGFGIGIKSPGGAVLGTTLIATGSNAVWVDVERIQGEWVQIWGAV